MPSIDLTFYAVEHKEQPGNYIADGGRWNGTFPGALLFSDKWWIEKFIEGNDIPGKVVKVTVHKDES